MKARVGISLSESDQILKSGQPKAIANLRRCNHLFVPTEFSRRAFNEMSIDVPISLWPLGIDPDVFRYTHRDFDANPFRFLCLGVTQFRKGSWLAPEAFIRAFSPGEPVHLTIASHRESQMYLSLKHEYQWDSRISFICREYENPTIHYDGAHVLVSPHLSEGWGLHITEAMALGIPCIVSRCSAPRDYFRPDCGWWIEMSDHYVPVSGCLVDTPGFWRLPSMQDLADKMRYSYEHQDECEAAAAAAAKYAKNHLTWVHGAQIGLKILGEL